MSLVKLRQELENNPSDYGGMTNKQIADALNEKNIPSEPDSISVEVFLSGMVKSEWDALAATDREYLSVLFSRDSIDVRTGTETRAALLALFTAGSTTRNNLINLTTIQISKAEFLGIGEVSEGDVQYVMENPA